MIIFNRLAELLGVRDDQVEDALQDTRRVKIQLDRRGFLLAGATLAAGPLLPKRAWSLPTKNGSYLFRLAGIDPVPGFFFEIAFKYSISGQEIIERKKARSSKNGILHAVFDRAIQPGDTVTGRIVT